VAVDVEVDAGRGLVVALGVAVDAEAVQPVQQRDAEPGADDPGDALERPQRGADDERDQAAEDDDGRQHVADREEELGRRFWGHASRMALRRARDGRETPTILGCAR
jgi:hypothetical protein